MKVLLTLILAIIFMGSSKVKKQETKYSVGDCVYIDALTITDKGEWDSSAFGFGNFKIIDIINTNKMNKYLNKKLHAYKFYKIKIINLDKDIEKYHKNKTYVIPTTDLDSYRYAGKFWELKEYNINNCNKG